MPFIAVRDFGPIAHAEVELKPLTVLIGANNTGKSYLALAIYSLSRAIAGINPRYGPLRSRRQYRRFWTGDRLAMNFKRAVGDLKSQLPELEKLWSEEAKFRDWPPRVQQWMRRQGDTKATVEGRTVSLISSKRYSVDYRKLNAVLDPDVRAAARAASTRAD